MACLEFKIPPNDILSPFCITCKIVPISFSYEDFTKAFPLSCLLSNASGLPYCINTAPIPCPFASSSTLNVLPKPCGVNTSASIKTENAKLASSFYTNDFFFKRDVNGPTMHALFLTNFL